MKVSCPYIETLVTTAAAADALVCIVHNADPSDRDACIAYIYQCAQGLDGKHIGHVECTGSACVIPETDVRKLHKNLKDMYAVNVDLYDPTGQLSIAALGRHIDNDTVWMCVPEEYRRRNVFLLDRWQRAGSFQSTVQTHLGTHIPESDFGTSTKPYKPLLVASPLAELWAVVLATDSESDLVRRLDAEQASTHRKATALAFYRLLLVTTHDMTGSVEFADWERLASEYALEDLADVCALHALTKLSMPSDGLAEALVRTLLFCYKWRVRDIFGLVTVTLQGLAYRSGSQSEGTIDLWSQMLRRTDAQHQASHCNYVFKKRGRGCPNELSYNYVLAQFCHKYHLSSAEGSKLALPAVT